MRLEAHLALCCGVTTPSFPNKADVEQLRLIYTSTGNSNSGGAGGAVETSTGGSGGSAATPAAPGKKGAPSSAVPASAGSGTTAAATPSTGIVFQLFAFVPI